VLEVKVLNKKTNQEHTYELDLSGKYQLKNILGVLATIENISDEFFISEENIHEGLKNVIKITGIQGRWQILNENPLVVADTGHNEEGIKEVLDNLRRFKYKALHFVLGVVNDKDVSKILELLPKEAVYYFTKASIPRALDQNELKILAEKNKLAGNAYSTVEEAFDAAKKKAKKDDLIFIGGSTFVVADALKIKSLA
jgi:dihydrofolate synthase/folylpolyglutamate synthase